MTAMITEEIKRYLEIKLNDVKGTSKSEVTKFSQFEDGWETEVFSFIWTFEEENNRITKKCVLRVLQGQNTNERIESEAEFMETLLALGIKVPKTIFVGTDESPLQRGHLVMEFIDGDLLFNPMMENLEKFFPIFIKCFVDLHSVKWRDKLTHFGSQYDANPRTFLGRRLQYYKDKANELQISELEPLIQFLYSRVEEIELEEFSLLHNDFHPNNIIVNPSNELVVFDWSGADVGDYRYDLAWTHMLVTSFLGPQSGDQVLNLYQQISGKEIKHFEFFEAMAYARRYVDLVSVHLGNSNLTERAASAVEGELDEMTQRFFNLMKEKYHVQTRF